MYEVGIEYQVGGESVMVGFILGFRGMFVGREIWVRKR